jgi:ComF family protein
MSLRLKLTAFFFPERCPFCSRIIEAEEIACQECMERIRVRRQPIVRGAGGYRCISSFLYSGHVRRMLIRIKFNERTQHIRQVAEILAQDIRTYYTENAFDLITCVPMHPRDMAVRGYNQSAMLSKELSGQLGIPYAETLEKTKRTKKQHHLNYQERKNNLNGAFRLIDKERIKGKRILIVDDIVTSGVTLAKCCQTISRAKPQLLCCATIARAGAYSKTNQSS